MSSGNADKAEPNLVPVLDMVFQLITFFMLVINFKSASLDLSLDLPVVGSARPVATKGVDLLVLNVAADGSIKTNGQTKKDPVEIERSIRDNGLKSQLAAKRDNPNFGPNDELPTIVVIRADESTPFEKLYYVIERCQNNNFRNFALRAMNMPTDRQLKKSK